MASEWTPQMDLLVNPPQCVDFIGPFDKPVVTNFTITNQEQAVISYKIKTTNNQRFRIRPVVGILNPNETATISVTCNPFQFNPAEVRPERFIILTTYMLDGLNTTREVWTSPTAQSPRRLELHAVYQANQDAPISAAPEGIPPLPEQADQPW